MSKIAEQEFWGSNRKKNRVNFLSRSEQNIRYFLIMIFCMSAFLWTGYRLSFLYPLGQTEARPDKHSAPAVQIMDDQDKKLTVLIIGSDRRGTEYARSDTIMVLFLDTKTKNVGILNIPRDTYVTIPSKRTKTKINHAYAYGGLTMAKETVENFLNIEIDRYVDTDFKGFTKLIDALGGIEYNVEKRMYYPPENIDIQPGLQTLNGEKALGYVRYRSDGKGDIGRVERQQKFLPVLADHVMSLTTLWKIPTLIGIFRENVETDLTVRELLFLGKTFRSFDPAKIKTGMLPGEPVYINDVSYWVSHDEQVSKLIDELTAETPAETGGIENQKETE